MALNIKCPPGYAVDVNGMGCDPVPRTGTNNQSDNHPNRKRTARRDGNHQHDAGHVHAYETSFLSGHQHATTGDWPGYTSFVGAYPEQGRQYTNPVGYEHYNNAYTGSAGTFQVDGGRHYDHQGNIGNNLSPLPSNQNCYCECGDINNDGNECGYDPNGIGECGSSLDCNNMCNDYCNQTCSGSTDFWSDCSVDNPYGTPIRNNNDMTQPRNQPQIQPRDPSKNYEGAYYSTSNTSNNSCPQGTHWMTPANGQAGYCMTDSDMPSNGYRKRRR